MQIEASIQELAQEGMETRLAAAQAGRDQSQAACQEAGTAVEAAERELAGAQAGDGRDESNRSLQERLADAQNAQARLHTSCLVPEFCVIIMAPAQSLFRLLLGKAVGVLTEPVTLSCAHAEQVELTQYNIVMVNAQKCRLHC